VNYRAVNFFFFVCLCLCLCLCLCFGFGTAAFASVKDDVGYTALVDELGVTLADGANVSVFHVEAGTNGGGAWIADASNAEFLGKTILSLSSVASVGTSSHATSVGQRFYGLSSSLAPGITDIGAHEAISWFTDHLGLGSGGDEWPDVDNRQVVNHSWVGGLFENPPGSPSAELTGQVIRFNDWFSAIDEVIQLYGSTNNSNFPSDNSQPLMGSLYNGMLVGVSDFAHGFQVIALDSVYVGGRAAIHIVVPSPTTSNATPYVSSAAALLIDAAKANPGWSDGTTTNRNLDLIQNAERVEVIKSALMAGASRQTTNTTAFNTGSQVEVVDLQNYRVDPVDQTANGLDRRYGAGQLNVYNSYQILAAGEYASLEDGGSGTALTGFDHDDSFGGSNGSNTVATYDLGLATEALEFSASLVWNLMVNGADNNFQPFDPDAELYNLDLELIEVGQGVIAQSASAIDNTENIWLELEAGKSYQLRVVRGAGQGNFNWDYGVAWYSQEIVEPLLVPVPIGALFFATAALLYIVKRFNRIE